MVIWDQLPVAAAADVVVAGGGMAGVAAALLAARRGANVALVEKSGTLGGLGTSGMVSMFAPRTDGSRDLSRGICSELAEEMCRRMNKEVSLYWLAINPEILKQIIDEKITAAGVSVYFDTAVAAVDVQAGRLERVAMATVRGLEQITAKVFIDATGDACLTAWAGVPCEVGDAAGTVMSPTLCVMYANVDWGRYEASGLDARRIWLDLADAGRAPLPERHFVGIVPSSPTAGVGNLGHIYGIAPLSAAGLARGYIEGRRIATVIHRFYREHVPGFAHSELILTASSLGIRESRRFRGDYVLTMRDYEARATFDDEIGRYNYPVDIHASTTRPADQDAVEQEINRTIYRPGDSYGIPYRALLPTGVENLLTVGRATSSDRAVQSSLRVMPGCCIAGQAAGIAAQLALAHGGATRAIDRRALQEAIRALAQP